MNPMRSSWPPKKREKRQIMSVKWKNMAYTTVCAAALAVVLGSTGAYANGGGGGGRGAAAAGAMAARGGGGTAGSITSARSFPVYEGTASRIPGTSFARPDSSTSARSSVTGLHTAPSSVTGLHTTSSSVTGLHTAPSSVTGRHTGSSSFSSAHRIVVDPPVLPKGPPV